MAEKKTVAVGPVPGCQSQAARVEAREAREKLKTSDDPAALRKSVKAQAVHEAASTFKSVVRDWHDDQAARRDATTAVRVLALLAAHIFPCLGARPMASIKPDALLS